MKFSLFIALMIGFAGYRAFAQSTPIPFRHADRWGTVDSSLNTILPAIYDSIVPNTFDRLKTRFASSYYLVMLNEKYGLAKDSQILIPPSFDGIGYDDRNHFFFAQINLESKQPVYLLYNIKGELLLLDSILKYNKVESTYLKDHHVEGNEVSLIKIKNSDQSYSLLAYYSYSKKAEILLDHELLLELKNERDQTYINTLKTTQIQFGPLTRIVLAPMEYDPFGIQPAFRDGFYCLEIKDQELSLRRVEYQYFDSIFSFDTSPGLRHTFYPDYSIYHSPYDDGRTYYHHIIRNDSIWVISGMPQNSGIIHRYARSSGDTLATSSFNADEWYTIRCRTLKATTGYLPFNVILYKIQGFWGVHTHSFTLPAQFDTVLTAWRNEHGSFFSVIKNGRCGLMGQDMKWMVEPNYDSIKLLNSQDQSFLLFKDDMVHLYLGSEQQVISGNFSEIKILDYQDFSYIISEKGTYRLCTKDPNGRSVSPAFQHIPKEILIIEDLILYKLYDENNRYLGLAGEWGTLYFSD